MSERKTFKPKPDCTDAVLSIIFLSEDLKTAGGKAGLQAATKNITSHFKKNRRCFLGKQNQCLSVSLALLSLQL